jgi:hypothetical protein
MGCEESKQKQVDEVKPGSVVLNAEEENTIAQAAVKTRPERQATEAAAAAKNAEENPRKERKGAEEQGTEHNHRGGRSSTMQVESAFDAETVRMLQFCIDAGLDQESVMALQYGSDIQDMQLHRPTGSMWALERRELRPEDYDLLGQLDDSIEQVTLSSEQLKMFPVESFQSPGILGSDPKYSQNLPTAAQVPLTGEGCSICLVDFEDGDELRQLLPCGHRFHRACIDRWLLKSSPTCPIDKLDLRCACQNDTRSSSRSSHRL